MTQEELTKKVQAVLESDPPPGKTKGATAQAAHSRITRSEAIKYLAKHTAPHLQEAEVESVLDEALTAARAHRPSLPVSYS